jgi:hypothetical protein
MKVLESNRARARMQIVIASLPDRERVVAEIWCSSYQLAELRDDGGEVAVEILPHPSLPPGWWAMKASWICSRLPKPSYQECLRGIQADHKRHLSFPHYAAG